MAITQELHDLVLQDEPICIWCGERKSEHCHHGIKRGTKSKHHPHPEYDVRENLAALCSVCNLNKGIVETHQFANWFGWFQLAKGIDVITWYKNLNLRIKDSYDWMMLDGFMHTVEKIIVPMPGIKILENETYASAIYKRISNGNKFLDKAMDGDIRRSKDGKPA